MTRFHFKFNVVICNFCIIKLAIKCCVICIHNELKKLLDSGKSFIYIKKNSSGPKMEQIVVVLR